ncbi:chromodomain-helicase-DNA-binding protein 3 isoform X1 [Tachysurus ichikawai]
MSSPLRSCEEDEGMAVNSEGGDFDEEEEDDGELDGNASDINSPAAPRETAAQTAAPGTGHAHAHAPWTLERAGKRTYICLQL